MNVTMTRRTALGTGLAALAGCAAPGSAAGDSLHTIARSRGLRFGTAIGMKRGDTTQAFGFDDPQYRALVARECGLIVPENELKWQALRPAPGRFSFEAADQLLAWAQSQNLGARGHTLLWHAPKWLPDWVNKHDFGANPKAEAERLFNEHISTVCRHYGTAIPSWDVVNESVDPETGALRDNAFTPHLGNVGQIELAFRLAREHAPHAQLVYNDFMGAGSYGTKHRAGVLKLLQALKARGAPVMALGLQSHLGTGEDGRWVARGSAHEQEWRRFLDEVSGMGLDLLITELDVNDRYLPADVAQRDADAAAMVREFLDVTLAQPRLRDVMAWGLADPYSWMMTWWPRADGLPKRPCPYDRELKAKPMRDAIAAALRAAPAR
jgi:endo-1,4-beta-xylanase